MTSYRHVALLVGDLRAAEDHYAELFDMELLFREGPLPDGRWASLSPHAGWDDVETAGVEIAMVALRRDEFVLALFAAEPSGLQTYALGLVMDQDEIEQVSRRLQGEAVVEARSEQALSFVDRFAVRWQLATTRAFTGAGEREGLWLEV